jgi:hypothetical protein
MNKNLEARGKRRSWPALRHVTSLTNTPTLSSFSRLIFVHSLSFTCAVNISGGYKVSRQLGEF